MTTDFMGQEIWRDGSGDDHESEQTVGVVPDDRRGELPFFLRRPRFRGIARWTIASRARFCVSGSTCIASPQLQPRAVRPQPGSAIAKLSIPRLDTQLFVVEGDDDAELRRGPGHLAGTAMPGTDGNCVIAGHRDTHFRVLKDIRKGDLIVLDTGGAALQLPGAA